MTQKEAHEKINKIYLLLIGNGEVGLCEQVRQHNTKISWMESKLKNMPKNSRSWITFGITILTFVILLYLTWRGK